VGVITDGDLRRSLERHADFSAVRAADMMTTSPQVVAPDERFVVAEERMRERNINSLVVVDEARKPLGVLQIYAG
jgi:arabinose-5-phosphate isomerase